MDERPKPLYPYPFDMPYGASDDKKTDYLKEFSEEKYVNKERNK